MKRAPIRGLGTVWLGCLVLACLVPSAPVTGAPIRHSRQGVAVPDPTQSPPVRAASLAREARAMVVKGDSGEALRLADEALALDPSNRDAVGVKIAVLAGDRQAGRAIDAYETWLAASGRHDRSLLGEVARGVLESLADQADRAVAARALEQLARAGSRQARAVLEKQRDAPGDRARSAAASDALARLGDRRAVQATLRAIASPGIAARYDAIRVATEARLAGAARALAGSLTDPDPMIRSSAANALAELGDRSAVQALRQRLTDSDRIVRIAAAAALKRLGESDGDRLLAENLGHELPEVRLLAASGFKDGAPGPWVAAIRPILENMNGRYRLVAAEYLLPVDRPAALETIRKAASDENPWIRADAVRLLAAEASPDLSALLAFLRDPSPWARVRAAARLASLGAGSARSPASGPTERGRQHVR